MADLDAADCAELYAALTAIAVDAARVIRAFKGGEVRRKADDSPVTAADEAAEAAIRDSLKRLAPGLPIISEEQTERPDVAGTSYFLVDPLDGTREFVAGSDEYAVNIALMVRGVPILGIVAAPELGLIWRGLVGRGAERVEFDSDGRQSVPSAIRTREAPQRELLALVSRSHLDPRTKAYLERYGQARCVPCGSAQKFCRIAEGSADLYPRLAPTRDWDVAAGQAVIEAAGGRVAAPDCSPIRYGTAELIIPGFIATGQPGSAYFLPRS
jgi:3'(2'), 5'-bisphosphate nucleotidase